MDKWIKTDKEKKSEKKKTKVINANNAIKTPEKPQLELGSLKKFQLNCSKKSCGYQKTVMKRKLNEKDLTCPRCKGKMNVNEF